MRVLVIDDSSVARSVLRRTLSILGHEDVREAHDGIEAIQYLAKNRVDMVICDWNMPGMDGLDFVRAVQQSPLREVPILMVSAESRPSRIAEIIRSGAWSYLKKPFTAEVLRRKIAEVTRQKELATRSPGISAISGSLSEIGFPDLVQLIASARLSGTLQLLGDGVRGAVDFRDGDFLDARQGDHRGEEAFFAAAEIERGSFAFEHADFEDSAFEPIPTMPLLMEVVQRRTEPEAGAPTDAEGEPAGWFASPEPRRPASPSSGSLR